MASTQTLRRCVLRNVECVVCQEPYGSEELGFKIEPVFLQCGHDLCQVCSRRISGSTCPVCRAPVSFSKVAKPFVEYVDPSAGAKKSTSNSELTTLLSEASKMLFRCDNLGAKSSIVKLQKSAKVIGESSLGKFDGDPNMKRVIHILSSVVTKLVDKLDFQTFQAPQVQENALRQKLAEMILAPISLKEDTEMSAGLNPARVGGFLHTPPPSLPSTPASQRVTADSTADSQNKLVINQLPFVGKSAQSASGQLPFRFQGGGSNAGQLRSSVFSTLSGSEEVTARRQQPDSPSFASSRDQSTSSSVFSAASNGASDFTFTWTSSASSISQQYQPQAQITPSEETRPVMPLRANNNAAISGSGFEQASSTNSHPTTPSRTEPRPSLPSSSSLSRETRQDSSELYGANNNAAMPRNGVDQPSLTNNRPATQTDPQSSLPGTSRTPMYRLGQCRNWATGSVRCTNEIVSNESGSRNWYCDEHKAGGKDCEGALDGWCRGTTQKGVRCRNRRYAAYCHNHNPHH